MPKLASVIEYLEEKRDEKEMRMVSRFPHDNETEIMFGSQLIVRESQMAVFFRNGQILDVFGPGRFILKTRIERKN